MNISYFLNISTPASTITKDGVDVLAISSFFIDEEFKLHDHKFNLHEYLKNTKPIPVNYSLFSGIDEKFLENNACKNSEDALLNAYRIILTLIDKNIYIVGWDILEVILQYLVPNLERFGHNIDINTLKNAKNFINIHRLASLLVPSDWYNGATYGIETTRYVLENHMNNMSIEEYNDFCKTKLKDKYMQSMNTNELEIFKHVMKLSNMSSFDEVSKFLNEPHILDKIPFGKYKDELFSDIAKKDIRYLNWLYENISNDVDKIDVKFTIEKIINAS